MGITTFGVERWYASHLAPLGPITAIDGRRVENVNSFARSQTLVIGFEYLHNFTELGTLCDTLHLAGHLERLGPMILLSSYCVYAPKQSEYRESDPLLPQNFVGARARMLEDSLTYLAERFETSLTILRLFNIYGAFQDDQYVVPTILGSAAHGTALYMGGADKIRGFLYVADLVGLLGMLLERQAPGLAIYNVGSDVPVSIHDLIRKVTQLTGRPVTPIFDATKVRPERDYDFAVPDLSKIRRELGWNPSTSLETGLQLTYQWILGRSTARV